MFLAALPLASSGTAAVLYAALPLAYSGTAAGTAALPLSPCFNLPRRVSPDPQLGAEGSAALGVSPYPQWIFSALNPNWGQKGRRHWALIPNGGNRGVVGGF